MKEVDKIREIGNNLIEAADQLEFERGIVGEAIRLLEGTLAGIYDRNDVSDFLRRYKNRESIYASRKLAEKVDACAEGK